MAGRARFAFAVLAFGYAFLYLPIALVIVYSFNDSRLVTVWAGFSLRWWRALAGNEAMLSAAWLSLRIAFTSACLSAILGLAAGYVLARVPRFFGHILPGLLLLTRSTEQKNVLHFSISSFCKSHTEANTYLQSSGQ